MLTKDAFNALYLGLVRSDSSQDLIKYLTEQHPERVESAQNWIRETLTLEVRNAQHEVSQLQASLSQLNPEIAPEIPD